MSELTKEDRDISRPVSCYTCAHLVEPGIVPFGGTKDQNARCPKRNNMIVNPTRPRICPRWTLKEWRV